MSDRNEFEVQVFNECRDLGHYVGREVFGDLTGDGIGVEGLFRSGTEWNRWNGRDFSTALEMTMLQQVIGNVNLGGTVFGGCFVFQNGGEGEVETWNRGQLFAPFDRRIDVRENENLAALQD